LSFELKKIGIVGEGKMGTSIFSYLLDYECQLAWLVSSESALEKAGKTFSKKMKTQVRSGIMTAEEYSKKLENTVISVNIQDLANSDLIIEAISEDILKKRELFSLLDGAVNPACIFTSNSSSITPSELAPSAGRLEKMAGMHFFFPVNLKQTVELALPEKTSPETKASLLSFLKKINKKAFLQDEKNAFILNRLLLDTQAGAYRLSLEGKMSYRQIDALVKKHLIPAGIFEFFDHVGIDIMLASIRIYTRNSDRKEFYSPLLEKLEELVSLGRLGVKAHAGFYDYCVPPAREAESPEHPESKSLEDTLARLSSLFNASVDSILDAGIVPKEELEDILEDYLGSPFRIR
jgi:3-hydroxyacyl-CoA dehydrogenase